MSRLSPTQTAILRHAATSRRRAPGAIGRLFPPYSRRQLHRRGLLTLHAGHEILTDAGVAALEDGNDTRAQQIARKARK